MALVTNVWRFSLNHGPGIRTTVFVKGCPLKCSWCYNPECINPYPEFYHRQDRCRSCQTCITVCPEDAIAPPGANKEPPRIDREKCTRCMKCVEACPNGALVLLGEPLTIDEIMKEVESDDLFYKNSGGGMTVSGGEPLFYPEFTLELLKRAKGAEIHTCLDTSGYANWGDIEPLLDYVDLVLFDIKTMDAELHREWTGESNELILANARRMAERGLKMRLRLPIIPSARGSDEDDIEKVAKFAKELGESVIGVDILPFHNWAESKYDQLGREYAFKGSLSMEDADVEDLKQILVSHGLDTTIEPWTYTIFKEVSAAGLQPHEDRRGKC